MTKANKKLINSFKRIWKLLTDEHDSLSIRIISTFGNPPQLTKAARRMFADIKTKLSSDVRRHKL